jgi:Cytochrome c554 and c-prime
MTLQDDAPKNQIVSLIGVALLLVALVSGGVVFMNGQSPRAAGQTEESEQYGDAPIPYEKWDTPVVAFIVTGQMHGYVDPCGCSDPQYGGLPRRYNFIQSLKAKKWDVVGIDLGELPATKGIHEQNLLKYELSVKALAAMDYKVIGIGRDEMLTPLGEALTQIWEKNRPFPRPLNLSMVEAAPGGQFYKEANLRQYEIIQAANVKIGVINMMGPDLREEFPKEKFLANQNELPKALDAFAKAGVEIGVILHHEYPNLDPVKFPLGGPKRLLAVEAERTTQALECAKFCAEARAKNPKIPAIQLMSVLVDESEPPTEMKQLDPNLPTKVVEIGHKGKYVGLVGVYRDKKGGYRVQYQKVLMEPKWKSPPGKEKNNPVIVEMEKYHQKLKDLDILSKFVRMPHPNQVEQNRKGLTATYVGSNRCKTCHRDAYDVWENTKHHLGTDTLEDVAKKHPPLGRQFDPECMKCHTTGFEHPGGYDYPVAKLNDWVPGERPVLQPGVLDAHNKKLRGVGCESCHGPGSVHVKEGAKIMSGERAKFNAKEIDAINPFRISDEERKLEAIAKRTPKEEEDYQKLFVPRMNVLNLKCIGCHDLENDTHWINDGGAAVRWMGKNANYKAIVHRTKALQNNNGGPAPAKKEVEPPRARIGVPRPGVIGIVEEKKK